MINDNRVIRELNSDIGFWQFWLAKLDTSVIIRVNDAKGKIYQKCRRLTARRDVSGLCDDACASALQQILDLETEEAMTFLL